MNSKPYCLKCKPMKICKTFSFLNDPPAIKVLSTVVFIFFCALGPFALTAQELPPRSVLVVGQSSCPACQQALPKLAYYAPKWQARGFSVRYYSLDSLPQDYSQYPTVVTRLPKRWDDPLIKKLDTYATPSYYYINEQGEVVAETATAAAMHLALIGE